MTRSIAIAVDRVRRRTAGAVCPIGVGGFMDHGADSGDLIRVESKR
ncbi:MAG: hypothetical protein WC729_02510 [Sphingomonas sp.]|jgi:hypothetical protein